MDSWSLLIEVVLLLGVCLVLGGICSLFRQSPLVGYLLAGMFLGGPGSFHVVRSEAHIEAISELGVALLMFSLGLEFAWRRLEGLGATLVGTGILQIVATWCLGTIAALWVGADLPASIALGAMVSLSSTAAVLRVLVDRAEVDSAYGRNSLAILLVQDVAVIPLALVLALLAKGGTAVEVLVNIGRILGYALVLIGLLYLLLNYVAVWVLRVLSVERNRELTVLLAFVVGLGSTWAARAVGLSPALGAFLAGMFLGSSPFATQVRADISSLRVVLLTLFFGAVGMVANPGWIAGHLGTVLLLAAAILLGKAIIASLVCRFFRQPRGVALATGLCVAQLGEFSFVLGNIGKESALVSDGAYTLFVSCAIVTLFVTPYLVQIAPYVASWIEHHRWRSAARPAPQTGVDWPEVVIVGFGPAGQAVGRAVAPTGRRVLVLDLNSAAKSAAEAMGLTAVIGDATQMEVLEHSHLQHARLVVITLPARSAALTVLQHVRTLAPTAQVIVRSRYQMHQADFAAAGAHVVVGDEERVGRGLSTAVLDHVERNLFRSPQ